MQALPGTLMDFRQSLLNPLASTCKANSITQQVGGELILKGIIVHL